MTSLIIGACLVIFAIEGLLISLEYFKMQKNTKLQSALDKANADKDLLGQRLAQAEHDLQSARAEVQGIYVLWNKSLESEKTMRHELHVAKTQLTYLAQKVIQGVPAPKVSQQAAYWETQERTPEAALSKNVHRESYQANMDFL
ncbi:hypothetical protein [Bdellovibrio bacteriovorus]|uniref:hypothetical protein n=1 Tax=Bdellovibrio bacteriovorus TaxID=959 RepID=UPI0035A5862C